MSQDEMARQASNSACDYQRVRRDGQWQLLPAALLVEGDLVLLAVNQHAPARVTSLSTGTSLFDTSMELMHRTDTCQHVRR